MVALLILALAGGYMLLYALSPLQTALESKGWSLMAYSRYSSAESFLNVFCCVLLSAGMLIDRLGVRRCGLLSGMLMLAGGAVNYYALTDAFAVSGFAHWIGEWLNLPDRAWNITPFCAGMPASAKLSALGFMLFGIGIEMAGVAASRATVLWFKGKELAVAMGVQLAGSRVVVALALWASPRIADWGAYSVARPVGWCVLVLLIGLICWIAYGFLQPCVRNSRPSGKDSQLSALRSHHSFSSPLLDLCRNTEKNRVLWLLAAICVCYYASLIPFYRYAVAMLQAALGTSADSAATVLASLPLVAALCTPPVCMIPDFRGEALWLMALGSACMAACYAMFAYLLPALPYLWVAYVGIFLLGVASAVMSAGLWPLLPRLAPERSLGSAYALFYWLQGWGLFLTPLGVAWVMGDSTEYGPAMLLFALFDVAALLMVFRLMHLNRRHTLGLNLPNRRKSAPA